MKGDFLAQIPLPGFFSLLLLEEMIAENRKKSLEHHSDKTMRLLRHKLLSSCLTFVSRFDDFII